MATYYVDGKNGNDANGNGSSANPWKTLSKAHDRVSPGDTIIVRTAVYREVLSTSKDNLTWKADDGHEPVLDGGYNESLFNDGQLPGVGGFIPGAPYGAMLQLKGKNTVVEGFTARNVGGRGAVVTGSGSVVRACRIDFCYGAGMVVTPAQGEARITNVVVENNTITRCSMKRFDPNREGAGPERVEGTCQIVRSDGAIVRHNIVAYNNGEGIGVARGTTNTLVEGNVVHTCYHVHLYMSRSRNTVMRNNFVYHLLDPAYMQKGGRIVPSGIVMGDEWNSNTFPPSAANVVYNNIVVNMGKLFEVRNGSSYDTQLSNSYVGYNTFISGDQTDFAIKIAQNKRGRPHENSIFENNIILHKGRGEISRADGNLAGITFRNNLWSEPPNTAMRGRDDQVGDPRLANPDVRLTGVAPGPTNADPFNYRLTKSSTLAIGKASDGSPVGGFRPPTVERDFFNGNRDNARDIGGHEYGGQVSTISANFSIGPDQQRGLIPHTVDFTDRSSSGSPLQRWSWDFGDGSTSSQQNPSHTYMQAGTYTVRLTVRDSAGQEDTIVKPEIIKALQDTPDITPDDFRRFVLVKVPSNDVIAFGTQYPDLSCVLLWNAEPFHVLNFATIADVAATYEKPGEQMLMWLDPIPENVEEEEELSFA
jgi:PKD repeat protein